MTSRLSSIVQWCVCIVAIGVTWAFYDMYNTANAENKQLIHALDAQYEIGAMNSKLLQHAETTTNECMQACGDFARDIVAQNNKLWRDRCDIKKVNFYK